jgi:CDP-paratose 2-epimerase
LSEQELRYEIDSSHTYVNGIREDMSLDHCLHSIFGASKVAADIMVQEYGRYFQMPTACFRGGTLTGPNHSAAQLHGFLGYVMRCAMTGTKYTIFGYKGKQVRDAIHSNDLIRAFHEVYKNPRIAEVYNIGGGRFSNVSVLEAIQKCQTIAGREMEYDYTDRNRIGDHIWWIGDNGRFADHYPDWKMEYNVDRILQEIYEANQDKWVLP